MLGALLGGFATAWLNAGTRVKPRIQLVADHKWRGVTKWIKRPLAWPMLLHSSASKVKTASAQVGKPSASAARSALSPLRMSDSASACKPGLCPTTMTWRAGCLIRRMAPSKSPAERGRGRRRRRSGPAERKTRVRPTQAWRGSGSRPSREPCRARGHGCRAMRPPPAPPWHPALRAGARSPRREGRPGLIWRGVEARGSASPQNARRTGLTASATVTCDLPAKKRRDFDLKCCSLFNQSKYNLWLCERQPRSVV